VTGRLTTDYADIFPPSHPVRHIRLASSAACYVICKLTYIRPRACQRQTLLAHRFFVKSPLDEEKNLRLGGEDVRGGVMALGVHSDQVAIIEGPVGYKRVCAFPGAGEVQE
jgi:hypothetical protein